MMRRFRFSKVNEVGASGPAALRARLGLVRPAWLAFLAVLAVLCAALLARPLTAYAYTAVNPSKSGTLSVTVQDGAGFAFHIYQVAEFTDAGAEFVPTQEVENLNADLGEDQKIDLGSGKWETYAVTLSQYAHEPYLSEALAPAVTDAEGKAVFHEVKPGVYLVLGTDCEVNGSKYSFSPMMVSVPAAGQSSSEAGDTWDYDVEAQAKYAKDTEETGKHSRRYTVTKYWQDDQGEGRPASIEVAVYRRDLEQDKGGTGSSYGSWYFAANYTLSDANNWTADWTGEGDTEYQVLENASVKNTDGKVYKVSISSRTDQDQDGSQHTWFALTNRKPGGSSSGGGGSHTPKGGKQNSNPPTDDHVTPVPPEEGHGASVPPEDAFASSKDSNRMTSVVRRIVRTGDETRLNLWLAAFIASGGVLVLYGIFRLRKKK
jgi:hypothetical protein